jgi:hypothetical protein
VFVSQLAKLQACKSRDDLAVLLGFKASAVAFLLHKMPAANRYTSYTIPKKGGGVRQIAAPIPQLKKLRQSAPACSRLSGRMLDHDERARPQVQALCIQPRPGKLLSFAKLRARPRLLHQEQAFSARP